MNKEEKEEYFVCTMKSHFIHEYQFLGACGSRSDIVFDSTYAFCDLSKVIKLLVRACCV